MPFMRTCQEAAALMLAREDRNLRLSEKAALRMHLVVCRACPNFERQLLVMRSALRQWRGEVDSGNAGDGETREPGATP